jgi:hypothetical protein
MTSDAGRERHIPSRRTELIELCIRDRKLPEGQIATFRRFCEMLSAYGHYQGQRLLETMKDSYVPFDPDSDTPSLFPPTPSELDQMEARLEETIQQVLQQANYRTLTDDEVEQALTASSLIRLQTRVVFEQLQRVLLFRRGQSVKTATFRRLFRQREVPIEVYDRVALLLRFKDLTYVGTRRRKVGFEPGKTYLYLYKNVPKNDLELLFPNTEVRMTRRDRLTFIVPIVGGAALILYRALPNLLLILGLVAYLIGGPAAAARLGIAEDQIRSAMTLVAAVLAVVFAVGTFAILHIFRYRATHLRFLKTVVETLFFRKLAVNASVLSALVDEAEEEETKEIILVYYHLLAHGAEIAPAELDARIEGWALDKMGAKVDFDIHETLRQLESLRATIHPEGEPEPREVSLVTRDKEGACRALVLDQANALLDRLWDDFFPYSQASSRS